MVLRKEDMHVAFWQQATEILASLTPMGIVVSGNDAGRNLNGFELRLTRANDGQIGALPEV